MNPMANHQPNIPQLIASTSRNSAVITPSEIAAQNECFTVWEPLQLRQEWTVNFVTFKALN
jgi:hypothetical protein